MDAILCAIKVKRAFNAAICYATEVKRAIMDIVSTGTGCNSRTGTT
jgi:hypothetical protein